MVLLLPDEILVNFKSRTFCAGILLKFAYKDMITELICTGKVTREIHREKYISPVKQMRFVVIKSSSNWFLILRSNTQPAHLQ